MAKYIVDYYETYSKSYEVEANSKGFEAQICDKTNIRKGTNE